MGVPASTLSGRASSPGRTRTYDKAVNSRLLYQLSYRGLNLETPSLPQEALVCLFRTSLKCCESIGLVIVNIKQFIEAGNCKHFVDFWTNIAQL